MDNAQWGQLGILMSAQLFQLQTKTDESPPALNIQEVPEQLLEAHERFQLQVRLDIENERELLYKSLLVVEVLVTLFVLRELLIRVFS